MNVSRDLSFSDSILTGWLKTSIVGLIVSLATWALGEYILANVVLTKGWSSRSLRIGGALLQGYGIGFGLLFLVTLSAGGIYWLLRRRIH